jgi:very-short-patch-repair endonuclease
MVKTKCKNCEKDIEVKNSRFRDSGNFCSMECWHKVRVAPIQQKLGKMQDCLICGKPFYVSKTRKNAHCCSKQCTAVYLTKDKKCSHCNSVFERDGYFGEFCSDKCKRESIKSKRAVETFDTKCLFCGNKLTIPSCSDSKIHFCSKNHFDKWQSRKKVSFVCKVCNEPFQVSPSRTVWDNPTYCSTKCRDADPDVRIRLIHQNAHMKRSFTSLEVKGYKLLDDMGIKYEAQKLLFGKFCVDVFVDTNKLVIQFDGDYWHGNPLKFPIPNKTQQRRMKLDKSQDAYFAKCGYKVLRIWESDFRDLTSVRDKLLLVLSA